MDYSLLVGIHDINRGNADRIRDNTLSVFEPNLRTLNRRATATTRNLKHTIGKDVFVKSDLRQLGPSTSKLPDQAPPEYLSFNLDVVTVYSMLMRVGSNQQIRKTCLERNCILLD